MKLHAELAFWQGEARDISAHDLGRYPRHLMLPTGALDGLRVLDVGCGPIAYASAFTGCDLWGIDPLIGDYQRIGYDLNAMTYVCAPAESMPFDDGFFDVAISMNALDHVDDFTAVSSEIQRVAKGYRFEVHYHAPTVTEPLALDDSIVRECFPDAVKLREMDYAEFYPWASGRVAVWSSPSLSRLTEHTTTG